MKMNWGYRITILYLGFMVIILTLVTICMKQTVELESKDYYAQELKYQERIDATKNANALSAGIEHEVNGKQIILSIPIEQLSKDFFGEIYFFCPSDGLKDIRVNMHFDATGKQVYNGAGLQKGVYKMKLSWRSNGKNFYKEDIINIK